MVRFVSQEPLSLQQAGNREAGIRTAGQQEPWKLVDTRKPATVYAALRSKSFSQHEKWAVQGSVSPGVSKRSLTISIQPEPVRMNKSEKDTTSRIQLVCLSLSQDLMYLNTLNTSVFNHLTKDK